MHVIYTPRSCFVNSICATTVVDSNNIISGQYSMTTSKRPIAPHDLFLNIPAETTTIMPAGTCHSTEMSFSAAVAAVAELYYWLPPLPHVTICFFTAFE